MNRQDKATEKFLSGYNCAQAVIWAFSDRTGFTPDTALRVATGLGAGMARRQEVCGAVPGGIVVLGMMHGRGEGETRARTEETYELTEMLMRCFEKEHGTCKCRDLLHGCDIATEEGRRAFSERDLLNTVCEQCVQSVVAILEGMIEEVPDRE